MPGVGAVFITQQDRQAGLLKRVAFEQRPAGGDGPRQGEPWTKASGQEPILGVCSR